MKPLVIDHPASRALKVLCLGAHPDDIEIGCGGTILQLTKEYSKLDCTWVVFSGSAVRKAEALAGARLFLSKAAARHVAVHVFRDGFFPYQGGAIKEQFELLKNRLSPDIIFTHYRSDLHQDHRLICELTWNTFRDHTIFEYEVPKFDGDFGSPNVFVPLAPAVARRKTSLLLRAFRSQAKKHWFEPETFLALMRLRGLESASRYAEAFYGRKVILAR